MQPKVTFLGHTVDEQGLHPTGAALEAIKEAPIPKSVTELRSFLGMVNHYSRYLPNLSTLLAPLHTLLKKGMKWHWGKMQQDSVNKLREYLSFKRVIVHYDQQKPLVLVYDASDYGIGAFFAISLKMVQRNLSVVIQEHWLQLRKIIRS
jgi:hypothetical protein